MSCCCSHSRSAARLFSAVARRYRRRFARRGFEPSQTQLLAGLEAAGYEGASLLEVGCGVGHLHQSLLERGASSAIGIDLAPKMISEAKRWAAQRGLGDRTRYLVGDFLFLGDNVEKAEVTLLDKVVCCYPDAEGLVAASLKVTKRVYALTYPRSRWFVRWAGRLGSALMWLLRSDFRAYVHDPLEIEHWIGEAGFRKRYEACTALWLTQVYVRP